MSSPQMMRIFGFFAAIVFVLRLKNWVVVTICQQDWILKSFRFEVVSDNTPAWWEQPLLLSLFLERSGPLVSFPPSLYRCAIASRLFVSPGLQLNTADLPVTNHPSFSIIVAILSNSARATAYTNANKTSAIILLWSFFLVTTFYCFKICENRSPFLTSVETQRLLLIVAPNQPYCFQGRPAECLDPPKAKQPGCPVWLRLT